MNPETEATAQPGVGEHHAGGVSQPQLGREPGVPTPDYYPPTYTPEPTHRSPWWKRAFGPLVVLGVLVVKFGAKLKGLLLLLPKLKLLSTSLSMLVSVGAYALIFGIKFAVGFVALLFVHEMGHYIQLRREGIRPSAMVFVPFLGAAVFSKSLGKDAAAEARVGLAGPILGSLGCLVTLALWQATGDVFWQALTFTGFFLNLINLLPVLPLDGGRAMAALAPWMWFVGYAALVVATVLFPNPVLLLVLIFGGMETWRRWKLRKEPEGQAFYKVKPSHRIAVAAVYIGLAAALAVGMDATHLERTFDDV